MINDLAEATDNEEAAIDELVAFKNKEINVVQDSIESKMVRSEEIAVQHAEQLHDLDDTTELAESKKFFADLDMNCANKRKELALYPFSFWGCPNAFNPNWEKRMPSYREKANTCPLGCMPNDAKAIFFHDLALYANGCKSMAIPSDIVLLLGCMPNHAKPIPFYLIVCQILRSHCFFG